CPLVEGVCWGVCCWLCGMPVCGGAAGVPGCCAGAPYWASATVHRANATKILSNTFFIKSSPSFFPCLCCPPRLSFLVSLRLRLWPFASLRRQLVRLAESALRRAAGFGRLISSRKSGPVLRNRSFALLLEVENPSQVDVRPGHDARFARHFESALEVNARALHISSLRCCSCQYEQGPRRLLIFLQSLLRNLLCTGKVARFHALLRQVHELRLLPFRCIQRVRGRAGGESYLGGALFLLANIDAVQPVTVDILQTRRILLEVHESVIKITCQD